MEYLKVGKIFKTYGLQGEVKVFSTTDFPELRFKKGNTLYLFKEETNDRTPVVINKATPVGGNIYVISLKGYNHINMIEQFIGMELQVEKDLKFLPKDTYFYDDLLGCEVYDIDKLIGKVIKIEDYSANRTLRVKTNNKEILIPFVNYFIKDVDIESKKIIVKLIEGML